MAETKGRDSIRRSPDKRKLDSRDVDPSSGHAVDRPTHHPDRSSYTTWIVLGIVTVAVVSGCLVYLSTSDSKVKRLGYRIVNEFPHDERAFSQGLLFDDGVLYESTGRLGESTLRRLNVETGEILEMTRLPDDFFGEGIAVIGNRIYQLTWQNRVVIVYDKSTLAEVERIPFSGEGWGLAYDGQRLIVSDGSATLRFVDPLTMKTESMLDVRLDGRRAHDLNELEYIDGHIFANVWHKDLIYKISPTTGNVVAVIDLSGLLGSTVLPDREGVLNGIAFDPAGGRLFVTGKLWPRLFEIELVETEQE